MADDLDRSKGGASAGSRGGSAPKKNGSSPAPALRVVLEAGAARGLAALLDDARPLAPAAPRCASFPFSQLIEFGY